jgi:hypothetical protein
VAWIVKLVSIGAEGEEHSTDVMRIARPDDLADLATLGLSLAEAKRLLAGVQRETVAAQARSHAARRPECRGCGAACRVKDHRHRAIATLFGQVAVRLPRFRSAGCATTETGVGRPSHVRSAPELDRLRAQFSALMTYRTAAEVLAQLFPVDAGADPETLRRHTLRPPGRYRCGRRPRARRWRRSPTAVPGWGAFFSKLVPMGSRSSTGSMSPCGCGT